MALRRRAWHYNAAMASCPAPAPASPLDGALEWSLRRFDQLPGAQLYALLRLRAEVFVLEQECAYLDVDGRDHAPGVWHLLGHAAHTGAGAHDSPPGAATRTEAPLLAYCRLLPPGLSFDVPGIGRVVVAPGARGRGLAHALMREALGHLCALWPGQDVALSAQQHLVGFYAAHGFVVVSEMYLEDGIPHVEMRRAGA